MNKVVRLKIEMGAHSLEFSAAHPDTEPGMQGAVSKLEQLVTQVNDAAVRQRDGFIQARTASARRKELRRAMLEVGIAHLAEVGRAAAREQPELGKVFRFNPDATTFVAFRAAARSMAAAAEEHKDTLVKFGMVQSVLDEFKQLLDQFDAAITQGNDGRSAHVGATVELSTVAQAIVRTIRVMDGRNRNGSRTTRSSSARGSTPAPCAGNRGRGRTRRRRPPRLLPRPGAKHGRPRDRGPVAAAERLDVRRRPDPRPSIAY